MMAATKLSTGLESACFSTQVDQVSEAEWNALLDQFADASIYQTWAYGAVSWGERQLSHLILRREGSPVALAQLRIVRLPILRGGAAYLRWGPLCAPWQGDRDETACRAMMTALIDEYVRRRRMLLRVVPRQFQQDETSESLSLMWRGLGLGLDAGFRPYRTIRVDLTPPLEVLRKQLNQKWRNQLNGAERNGLEIVEGTGDELYRQFLELYRDLMARKRFETTVDVHEFRRIQQRLPDGKKMMILIGQKDGRPVTGLVGSVVGDMGIYLLGATSDEGMKTKGSYLVQWRMMRHLKERGCRFYDLGGINPEANPGVYHFKQGMGGQEIRGLGRFSLGAGHLSAASVRAGEGLAATLAKLKRILRRQETLVASPASSPGPRAD